MANKKKSNNKNILTISECISGNHHDRYNLVPIVKKMFKSLKKMVKIKKGIYFNADSGFDILLYLIKFTEIKYRIGLY